VVGLQEITGMEGNIITTQEIFAFQQRGIDREGQVRGRFVFGGVRPKFIERFRVAGVNVSPDLFDPTKAMEV
jgi:pilus assembly protein CpaF